jgi:hypothetical protein
VTDVVSSDKVIGWQASENSQTKLTAFDYHKYPNNKLVMKAINGMDVIFSDKHGKLFQVKKTSDLKKIYTIMITLRH